MKRAKRLWNVRFIAQFQNKVRRALALGQSPEHGDPFDFTLARGPVPVSMAIDVLEMHMRQLVAGVAHEILHRRCAGHPAGKLRMSCIDGQRNRP